MREILFKGKTNDEWVQGFLAHKNGKWYISNQYGSPFTYKVNPDTICQYTGLTDKNGNRIWENDIVNTNSNVRVQIKFGQYSDGVTIWKYHQGFYMDFSDKGRDFYRHELGYWHNKIEVIGNIFENPGLLQEVQK